MSSYVKDKIDEYRRIGKLPGGKMSEWQPIADAGGYLAPDGILVETKIDDENGVRNIQKMMRRGNLWINAGEPNEMYVYYTPTHWR